MAKTTILRQAFSLLDTNKREHDYLIPAILGFMLNGVETVDVPDRQGYVYARVRSNLNEVIQVFNDKVAPVYDLPVLLLRDPNVPTRYKIDGRDVGRYENWGTSAAFLAKHGNTHSFDPAGRGGGDMTWVYSQQIMPWNVIPSGTYGSGNVLISAYPRYNSQWVYVGNTGTASLLAYKPTGTLSRMVLVYLNSSNNPTLLAGDPFDSSISGTALLLSHVPATPASTIPLAAVRVDSDTSTILWDDIIDVRPFFTGGGGTSSSLTVSGTSTVNLDLVSDKLSANVIPGGIKLDDLGTPDDNTDLNASTGSHGLLPKLGGGAVNFLRADGTWAVPGVTGSSSHNAVTVSGTSTVALNLVDQDLSANVLPGGIKLDDLGTPDDNTDLNVSAAQHGLMPKLPGGTQNFYRADGTWADPAVTGTSSHAALTVSGTSTIALDLVGQHLSARALGFGFGGTQLLRSVVTAAAGQAAFTATGIAANYDFINIQVQGKARYTGSSSVSMYIAFNDDTVAGNYFYQFVYTYGNTVGGLGDADRFVGAIGSTLNAQNIGQTHLAITNPGGIFHKMLTYSSLVRLSGTFMYERVGGLAWGNTDPINKISLTLGGGLSFASGSFCSIVGYRNFE